MALSRRGAAGLRPDARCRRCRTSGWLPGSADRAALSPAAQICACRGAARPRSICALAPVDQLARGPSSRSICAVKPISSLARFGRADAVAHQRRLAARRVIDRLVGAGQIEAASRRPPSARCACRFRHCRSCRSTPACMAQRLARRNLRRPRNRRLRMPSPRMVGPSPRSIASSIFMITAI